jgi:two-component system, chemotaxis family, chemotaxis protein CheY
VLGSIDVIQRLVLGLTLRPSQFGHRLSLASSARAGIWQVRDRYPASACLEVCSELVSEAGQDGHVAAGPALGVDKTNLGWVAVEVQILDAYLDKLADPRTREKQRFDHRPLTAAGSVGSLDQALDFEAIETIDGACPTLGRCNRAGMSLLRPAPGMAASTPIVRLTVMAQAAPGPKSASLSRFRYGSAETCAVANVSWWSRTTKTFAAVAELLSMEGYAVATAANGKEALRLTNQAAPDGIVLDLMMPMMDGWGFLACVRTLPACSGLPIVVMSAAYISKAAAERLRDFGVRAVIEKPFDLDALVGLVQCYIPLPGG